MLLSRNLDQNMQKNVLFFAKKRKIAEALGAPPQTPVGLRQLGALPPDPRVVTLIICCSYFRRMRLQR